MLIWVSGALPNMAICEACVASVCISYNHVYNLYCYGPYNNLHDKKVSQFVGLTLLHCYLSPKLCGEPVTPDSIQSITNSGHQESWSPEL